MLLFCDSYDHYDTAHLLEKYTAGGSLIQTGGRTGPNCLLVPAGNGVQKAFTNDAQFIVGLAYNPTSLPASSQALITFYDQTSPQCSLHITPTGAVEIHIYPNDVDTIAATSASGIIHASTYQYVEISVVFATSATGSASVQVNGVGVASATNIVTSSSANSYANLIWIGYSQLPQFVIDDLYICDGSGTINNSFLGDVSILMVLPNANGALKQFSQVGGTSGSNYTSVDEVPPDDDTSYVYSSTAGNVDAYKIASIGSPSSVIGVQVTASARKDDSLSRVLAVGFGNSTTQVFDTGFSLSSSYIMYSQPYDENPITLAPWQVTDLTSGQIALKVIS